MKKKILWLTDIHLDHIDHPSYPKNVSNFCKLVRAKNPDGIVITGDITSASKIKKHFEIMIEEWEDIPVYFVLGNHDYYDGSFGGVDFELMETIKDNENFHYLTKEEVIELTPTTAITGHNGWYDGQYSDWFRPGVVIMNDYYVISDFLPDIYGKPHNAHIYGVMQKKAKECQDHILKVLPKALEKYQKVIFATHVPPFEDATIYNGKRSNWQWMPNFSSKLCGDGLLNVARRKEFSEKEIIVLCGHTHGKAECHPAKNIVCFTGYSQYKYPSDSIVEIEVE